MSSPWSPDKYISAFQFATKAHRFQKIAGTNFPYMMHFSLVCMEVMTALTVEPGHDGDLAIQIALLHDVIEDTDETYDQIYAEFDKSVANGVLALSKDKSIEKSKQMEDCLRRIKLQSPEVGMVKLADRITNLQPPPKGWTRGKIVNYRAEARVILDTLKDTSPMLASRLADKIESYSMIEH